MNGSELVRVCYAEWLKLGSRTSARLGWLLALGIGVLGPLALWWAATSSATINGAPMGALVDQRAHVAASWSLEARNFFVFKAWIGMLAALSFAGEFQGRTLREDLLRPVARSTVLLGKWFALGAWSAVALGLTWLSALLSSLLLFPDDEGQWMVLIAGFGASWLSDVAMSVLCLAGAVWLRSVAGTLVGLFLFLLVDGVVGMGFKGLAALQVDWAMSIYPWLPNAALNVWQGYAEREPWRPESFGVLAVLMLVGFVAAQARFQRLDVG